MEKIKTIDDIALLNQRRRDAIERQRKTNELVSSRIAEVERLHSIALTGQMSILDKRFISGLFEQNKKKSGSGMLFLSDPQVVWLKSISKKHPTLNNQDQLVVKM